MTTRQRIPRTAELVLLFGLFPVILRLLSASGIPIPVIPLLVVSGLGAAVYLSRTAPVETRAALLPSWGPSWSPRWNQEELARIGAAKGVQVQSIYGGDSMAEQVRGIEAGAHVAVGTPGRVLDLLRRGSLRLGAVKCLVLDEADRMLDMGFAVEMGQIMSFVPKERQTLLFSATVPLGIRGIIYNYLKEPRWVLLSEDFAYVKEVRHTYIITPKMQKEAVLEKLIELGMATDKRAKLQGKCQTLWSCKSGNCGLCLIKVVGNPDGLSKPAGKEKRTLKTMVDALNQDQDRNLDANACRLACLAKVAGPVEIELLGDTDASD